LSTEKTKMYEKNEKKGKKPVNLQFFPKDY
jgi:hypothetical protein